MGYKCNSEEEMYKYFDIYKQIFIYFTNNKILPSYTKNPFEKYFYTISSTLKQNSN